MNNETETNPINFESDEYKAGFKAGMLAAADEVETHWNNINAMSGQYEQAKRSADVLRRLAKQKTP